jgi:hypothetical protein
MYDKLLLHKDGLKKSLKSPRAANQLLTMEVFLGKNFAPGD